MALGDTFGFDEAKYAEKIKSYTTQRLHEDEQIKYRQRVGAGVSTGGGILLAPLTGGVTLIGSLYGARRLSIADQKLHIIEAELKSRGIEPFTPKDSDVFIPAAITAATLGIAHGLPIEAHLASHASSTLATEAVAHTGTQAVHDVVADPSMFVHGMKEGIEAHGSEITTFFEHGAGQAANLITAHSDAIIANAPYACPAEVVGAYVGEAAVSLATTQVATFMSGKFSSVVIKNSLGNASQVFTMWPPSPGCPRLWSLEKGREPPGACTHCHSTIQPDETYYRK
jgi:hypothetical protein